MEDEVKVVQEIQQHQQQQVKNKGKQKIVIESIKDKAKKQVTFSKRRSGLFKKAAECSQLSGSQIAIITFSGSGKVFPFGSPSVDSVLDRYLNVSCNSSNNNKGGSGFWWDKEIGDDMGLVELEQFKNSLLGLRNQVVSRLNELSNPGNQVVVSRVTEINNASMMMNFQPQGFRSCGFTTDQHSNFVQDCAPVLECAPFQDFGFGSSEFTMDKDSSFIQKYNPDQDVGFGSSGFIMNQDSTIVQECAPVQDFDFDFSGFIMDKESAFVQESAPVRASGFIMNQDSTIVQECAPVQDFGFDFSEFIMDKESALFVQESAPVREFGFGSSEFIMDKDSTFVQECTPFQDFGFSVTDHGGGAQDFDLISSMDHSGVVQDFGFSSDLVGVAQDDGRLSIESKVLLDLILNNF